MTDQKDLGRYTAADVDNYYASGQWSQDNYTDLLKARAESHADKVADRHRVDRVDLFLLRHVGGRAAAEIAEDLAALMRDEAEACFQKGGFACAVRPDERQ